MNKFLKKFKNRSADKELIDDPNCADLDLIKNLKEFQKINFWLNSKNILINSLKLIHKRHSKYFQNNCLKISDLGCGGGDLLMALQKFLNKNNLEHDLHGLDFNPVIIQYASQYHASNKIQYKIVDFLSENSGSYLSNDRNDIVCLNNICHHLSNQEISNLIKKLLRNTQLAIIINDLHRHLIPYYAIKIIAYCFNLSHFAKHDGPLSVLRAFTKSDLTQILFDAAVTRFHIKWCWPFRWQVIIWTTGDEK